MNKDILKNIKLVCGADTLHTKVMDEFSNENREAEMIHKRILDNSLFVDSIIF